MTTSSKSDFFSNFNHWLTQLTKLNIRGLLLTTENILLRELIRHINNSNSISSLLDLTNQKTNSTSDKVESYLGSECRTIVFDATINFDPNLFAAVTGSLIGGGVLILKLKQSDFNYALTKQKLTNGNIDLFLTKDTSAADLNICPVLKRVLIFSINNLSTAIVHNQLFCCSDDLFKVTEIHPDFSEQQILIEKLKRVSTGHANRPLVITANRGRGKSAALGIAIAQLINSKSLQVIVTAPQINNLYAFYLHLIENINTEIFSLKNNEINLFLQNKQKPLSDISLNKLKNLYFNNGSSICFLAIDQIIKNKPVANLLIIDEAAAVPVGQLEKISQNYNRLIFSTTTDGYEGNGKGFEIRFKKQLLKTKPQTVFATLKQPIRWSIKDELERSCFNALLLDSKLSEIDLSLNTKNIIQQLTAEIICKKQLQGNETDLRAIFSLLINAHYQTRPTDLKTILEDTKAEVFIVRLRAKIISVCLIKHEGDLDLEISQKINDAQRRLKGEFLPQTIITNFGMKQAATKKYFRIMRIATHPKLQNKGIGSYLLSRLLSYAKNNSIDFIGTSFSATEDVISFWLKNEFKCIRFGSSKDSSTGNHSVEMLQALNDNSIKLLKNLTHRFNESFLFKQQVELKDLDLTIVSIILLKQLSFDRTKLKSDEMIELMKFAEGKRSYSAIDWLLLKLLKLKKISLSNDMNNNDINFLIAILIKQMSFSEVARLFNLTGKKQATTLLRELTQKLILL